MALENEAVVLRLPALVGDVEGDERMAALYCALDELLERVAPELNRRAIVEESSAFSSFVRPVRQLQRRG